MDRILDHFRIGAKLNKALDHSGATKGRQRDAAVRQPLLKHSR